MTELTFWKIFGTVGWLCAFAEMFVAEVCRSIARRAVNLMLQ